MRGHFVHVQLGSHLQLRASTRKGLLVCGQIPRTTRMCNILGGARSQDAFAGVHACPLCPRAARQPSRIGACTHKGRLFTWAEASIIPHVQDSERSQLTSRSCSSAYVATLVTSSWTAQLGTHAPSIWISARFMRLRCGHAVCTMKLFFMKYTIAGEEPRAPRPVP